MTRGAWRQRLWQVILAGAFTAACGSAEPTAAPVLGAAGTETAGAGRGQEVAGAPSAGGTGGGSSTGTGGSPASNGGTPQAGQAGQATMSGAGGQAAAGGAAMAGAPSGGSGGYPLSDGKPTVYLAGDSTVQTYGAAQAPQQGWGQRIQEFFSKDVSFVNKAIGGRSSKSFIDEGRLKDIEKLLMKGDYLFCQWGINDRYTSDPTRYTNPASTFRDYLKQYITAARGKGAIPVLVTPTPRLDYQNGVFKNDFPAYCEAISAVGVETGTPVIDLQTKALAYYTSVGYDLVQRDIALDVLHFKVEGAYQMARLVAEGTRELGLPISGFVK